MVASLQALLRILLVRLGLIPKPDYLVRIVPDHPERQRILPGVIYVVGGSGYRKWAYFRCPTGNDDVIQLSLQPKHRPCWEVSADMLGRPSVQPSVRQLDGSYAHFWIRDGRVIWCADTGRRPDFTPASWTN